MPGGADGLDTGNAEVENNIWSAERSKETAAGGVHVDVNADTCLVFVIVQGLGNFRR